MAKIPGNEERKIIEEALPRLSRGQRAAFAAGCVERVLPLVEHFFGHAQPCRGAIEQVWRVALGEPVDPAEVAKCAAACDAWVDELHENGETGGAIRAVKATWYALHSLDKPEAKAVQDAVWEAQTAVDFEESKQGDEFIQEEAEWQVLALRICETETPRRDMFAALPHDPRWLRAFRSRG